METNDKVMRFIRLITGEGISEDDQKKYGLSKFDASRPIIEEIFTSGDCGRFALILKFVFPEAKLLYAPKSGHILTKIGEYLYDVRGKYKNFYISDEDGNLIPENLVEVDEDWIKDQMLDCNYSFERRGPMV